jgi:hypothetical protein
MAFDVIAFKAIYPAFATTSNEMLWQCFNEACLYFTKTPSNRDALMNMLTAHIAELRNKPVGRMMNATEGSVTVGLEYGVPGSAPWYQQTQYGASFWAATSSLRGFRYIV